MSVAALVFALAAGASARASGPIAPGQPAPAVALLTADGATMSVPAQKGKVLLVDFWASWCGPCQAAFPALDGLYREMHDRGLEVMAINVDEKRADAAAFLSDKPHAMPVVFDPKGTAPTAFQVTAMPTSFLIGRDGRVRFVHVGYTAKTIDSYRREIEQLLAETNN